MPDCCSLMSVTPFQLQPLLDSHPQPLPHVTRACLGWSEGGGEGGALVMFGVTKLQLCTCDCQRFGQSCFNYASDFMAAHLYVTQRNSNTLAVKMQFLKLKGSLKLFNCQELHEG